MTDIRGTGYGSFNLQKILEAIKAGVNIRIDRTRPGQIKIESLGGGSGPQTIIANHITAFDSIHEPRIAFPESFNVAALAAQDHLDSPALLLALEQLTALDTIHVPRLLDPGLIEARELTANDYVSLIAHILLAQQIAALDTVNVPRLVDPGKINVPGLIANDYISYVTHLLASRHITADDMIRRPMFVVQGVFNADDLTANDYLDTPSAVEIGLYAAWVSDPASVTSALMLAGAHSVTDQLNIPDSANNEYLAVWQPEAPGHVYIGDEMIEFNSVSERVDWRTAYFRDPVDLDVNGMAGEVIVTHHQQKGPILGGTSLRVAERTTMA